jgi:glutathione S-transferase
VILRCLRPLDQVRLFATHRATMTDHRVGRNPVADITIYDTLDVAERQVPGCLDAYQNLKAFHTRVEARPNIAKWIASEQRAQLFAFPVI